MACFLRFETDPRKFKAHSDGFWAHNLEKLTFIWSHTLLAKKLKGKSFSVAIFLSTAYSKIFNPTRIPLQIHSNIAGSGQKTLTLGESYFFDFFLQKYIRKKVFFFFSFDFLKHFFFSTFLQFRIIFVLEIWSVFGDILVFSRDTRMVGSATIPSKLIISNFLLHN